MCAWQYMRQSRSRCGARQQVRTRKLDTVRRLAFRLGFAPERPPPLISYDDSVFTKASMALLTAAGCSAMGKWPACDSWIYCEPGTAS